jgi:hypothetical protein
MNIETAVRKTILAPLVALGAALIAGVNPAVADITYDVDIVSGQKSIVGTITTDGKIGALQADAAAGPTGPTDFVSWNLELTAGSFAYDDVGPSPYGSSNVIGQSVFASANTLSVDFSAIMAGAVFELSGNAYASELTTVYVGGRPTGFTLRIPGTEFTDIGFHDQPFIAEPDALVQIGQAEVMSAPEIDTSSAAAGLTLIGGMLLILRGRRPFGAVTRADSDFGYGTQVKTVDLIQA